MCHATEFMPVRSLPAVDGVLLWAMRAWAVGMRKKIPVEEKIQNAFARIGAPDATGQLYGFMWILGQGKERILNVDCTCHPFISADERSLLDITALSQQDRSFEALLMLRAMVRPATALAAHDAAKRVAASLSAAGRFLQLRTFETRQYIIAPGLAGMDTPVLPTLH
jgi:hypothetical protein